MSHAHCREYCMTYGKALEWDTFSKQLAGVMLIQLAGGM